jgi:hypothetical protein
MIPIFLPMIFPGLPGCHHRLPQIERCIFQEILKSFLREQDLERLVYIAPNGRLQK